MSMKVKIKFIIFLQISCLAIMPKSKHVRELIKNSKKKSQGSNIQSSISSKNKTEKVSVKKYRQQKFFAQDFGEKISPIVKKDKSRAKKDKSVKSNQMEKKFSKKEPLNQEIIDFTQDKMELNQPMAIYSSQVKPMKKATKQKKSLKKSLKEETVKKQYVFIVNSKTQQLTKYQVHQGIQSVRKLNSSTKYIPPSMTCDQDCESTDQIVKKGIEYTKRDLFESIRKYGSNFVASLQSQNEDEETKDGLTEDYQTDDDLKYQDI